MGIEGLEKLAPDSFNVALSENMVNLLLDNSMKHILYPIWLSLLLARLSLLLSLFLRLSKDFEFERSWCLPKF